MSPAASTIRAKLTESLEDYLEAIAELTDLEGHAHSKRIAELLEVKMPSVTTALRTLTALSLIEYRAGHPVQLTRAGEEIARRVAARHTALKRFFADILGMQLQAASDTACRLEHVIDDTTTGRFLLFSEALLHRSDASALRSFLTEAMRFATEHPAWKTLSSLQPGETATVAHFGRNLAAASMPPLALGDQIAMEGFSMDRTSLRLTRDGTAVELTLGVAENIWAAPAE